MSRIHLGGGRSISIRDYAVGLSLTGTAAGAVRYAQGKDGSREKTKKSRTAETPPVDSSRKPGSGA